MRIGYTIEYTILYHTFNTGRFFRVVVRVVRRRKYTCHVVDKIGHECQNLAIEHGFLAIKQWPANRR